MIEACALVEHYGATAVDNDLNFTIRAGLVTGFLGPNGVDKTATIRLIFGLDYPSAGSVLGGRTARNQLLGLARPTASAGAESMRCSRWLAWPRWRARDRLTARPLRPALATCSHGTAGEGCLLSADQPPEHQSADDLENAHDDEPDAE
jgi:energy-coupling factor transporter ATP-binding protein EcfA2